MLLQFQGQDSKYQQQYNHFRKMVNWDGTSKLKSAKATDVYLYWDDEAFKSQGAVQLKLDLESQHYVITNVAHEMNHNYLVETTYHDQEYLYADSLISFYQAAYRQLQNLFADQATIKTLLNAFEMKRSIEYGNWSYVAATVKSNDQDQSNYWIGCEELNLNTDFTIQKIN